MDGSDSSADRPPVEEIDPVFHVADVRTDGDRLLYIGQPLVPGDRLEREVWPVFREYGYEVSFRRHYQSEDGPRIALGRSALVAKPQSIGVDGIPWTNIVFAVLTVISTLIAGVAWYHIDVEANPLHVVRAWPFTVAVLGVLGVHELGHYVMSRYHRVDASLPYFIPFPTIFGTMGAVIRMKGRIPDREALFDIGVAGPLAGLVATVVVTVVGLHLDPVAVPAAVANNPDIPRVEFHYPLLLQMLADVTGQPLTYDAATKQANPVVFGGWIGMFVTFLNLLPVGQLDGGHILRAILGERTETFGAAVPAALFGLAGYLFYVGSGNAVGIWFFWGLFAMLLAYTGPATPVDDAPLDRKRIAIGALTFVLGLLCFTPVPIEIVTA